MCEVGIVCCGVCLYVCVSVSVSVLQKLKKILCNLVGISALLNAESDYILATYDLNLDFALFEYFGPTQHPCLGDIGLPHSKH